ncbi:MAG: 16S rRNA (cytosine(1402)-N(4))-methyltransferase RsmH [Lachnospiraceae bacterium]|uniref:Ribosomal RNA small subunit methyltransferase H n=1 Tax=Candidatus Weimeria bifida TaxID=2599074 RepID=A0A6N7IZM4_9FIRM|nr:16S rRNA (cytosine(1402)-N(4))-methyltransferase RsmH [Candidatus Weimeria bifida]RRF96248.1 MAG: 16S rRNA (cytosine(1402)-N(4))-methyltransferase RsmH [Lachnospiraceae bacterium]
MTEFKHYPVMLEEVIDSLDIKPDGIYVDGTLGGAGHSFEIAKRLTEGGRLIGIDQDTDAIAAAGERLSPFSDRVTIVHDNYEHIGEILSSMGIEKVDGILLDLGVSSYQLDTAERGFSYKTDDAPLDMRMDRDSDFTAKELLNTYSEKDLTRIIRDYGEEKFADRIAKNIVKERPLETTGDLNRIIRESIPEKFRRTGGNPSKRTFQAIRIELNRELTVLTDTIDTMIDLLEEDGRLAIITFHSLEDRIVKSHFKKKEYPCTCPPDFPVCVCGNISKGYQLKKKPILPSEKELTENKRSKSAKLRVFVRATSQNSQPVRRRVK